MRDRLVDLILECRTYTPEYEPQARLHAEYLANHLLNNGVIVPPVKVGDTVYHIRRTPKRHGGSYIIEAKVNSVLVETRGEDFYIECFVEYTNHHGDIEEENSIFGKISFRTRTEAEKALTKYGW